jgi:RimJ/RimL family protein N-acetyltransferase
MRLQFTSDLEEFTRRATPFIEPRLDCNVMATVLENVREGLHADSRPAFAYGLEADGSVGMAALRAPPWPMLVAGLTPADAPEFVARWLEIDPELSGVNAPPVTSRAVAAAWRAQTGRASHVQVSMAMHSLTEVREPARPATGKLRQPEHSEHELLSAWEEEFARESHVQSGGRVPLMVSARLARGALWLWDDGAPVTMVGWAGPVVGVARVGPVYTAPEHRGQGYATTATAAVSRLILDRVANTCMLFTDLANPTSNKIYAEIGYRRFADWEEHAFAPSAPR